MKVTRKRQSSCLECPVLVPLLRWPSLFIVSALSITACGEGAEGSPSMAVGSEGGSGGNSAQGGTNATGGQQGANSGSAGGATGTMVIGSGVDSARFNQCGVAAPLPSDTGACVGVSASTIADFDDYDGGDAASYGYTVFAEPPSSNVAGGILHIDDGSDAEDSEITTKMVTGIGGSGYALQVANTNAVNWGGLLMFYFTGGTVPIPCLDAGADSGLRFSIKGSSPSGRFAVALSMVDTTPTADKGLCDNASSADCKDANIQLSLPADADTWLDVELPWSALTPGVGSDGSCIPVTGQNVTRIVIQPLMNYPPPDFTFEAGSYSIAVDNLRLY